MFHSRYYRTLKGLNVCFSFSFVLIFSKARKISEWFCHKFTLTVSVFSRDLSKGYDSCACTVCQTVYRAGISLKFHRDLLRHIVILNGWSVQAVAFPSGLLISLLDSAILLCRSDELLGPDRLVFTHSLPSLPDHRTNVLCTLISIPPRLPSVAIILSFCSLLFTPLSGSEIALSIMLSERLIWAGHGESPSSASLHSPLVIMPSFYPFLRLIEY